MCRHHRLPVRAQVLIFDFSSIISESSFLSLVRAVAPRNIVLLQEPPPAYPIVSRLEAAVEGYFTHIHTPPTGVVVTLPATSCYVAALSPALAEASAAAGTVPRPPYRLGWLDGVVTGALTT
jgi:hypothetical protein